MKFFYPSFVSLLLALLVATPNLHAKGPQSDAGGVVLTGPDKGKIEIDTSLSVSFPSAMVGADKIDLAGEPCPLHFEPVLPGDWLWKSQTDGQFVVKGPVLPGQKYAVTLAPGLHDLAGTAVAPAHWGADLHTTPFEVHTTWESEDRSLPAKPNVVLQFTYRVRLQDAAEHVYFQDRDSHARQPAEISLHEEDRDDDEPEAAVLRATPRGPLPPGRTWDLVVEDVREGGSGQPTPYLKRIGLGATQPLALLWLGAFNLPLGKPEIRARFGDTLDPATANRDSVRVEPAVPGMTVRADNQDLIIGGNFDRAQHYKVTIQPALHGEGGYGLTAPVTRGATFRPKASALFFPGSDPSERARLGLRFSFLQVHTGPLRWRLAPVPLEKLALVQSRLREWRAARKNPVSGESETDDAGQEIPQPTELLVDTLGLRVRGEGTFPASTDETESLRDLRWSPPDGQGVPPGAYLLEIDGPRREGKGIVGNRALVYFSETVLTRKRTSETVLARLAGMADGLPRPGVTVRALSEHNFEVARAVTGPDGVAEFAAKALTPSKGERGGEPAQTLVADTPEGPAVSPLSGTGLDETYLPETPAKPLPPTVTRGIVLTDRSLYRPGQTVKIRGLVRTVATRTDHAADVPPTVPAGAKVFWTLRESDQDEILARGETTVDPEGGWSAEWDIPTDSKLAGYVIRATVGAPEGEGEDEGASRPIRAVLIKVQDYKVPLFEVKAEEAPAAGPPAAPRAVCRVRADYFSGQPVAGAKVAWRVHWDRRDYLSRRNNEDATADDATEETNRNAMQLDDRQSEHAKDHDDASEPPETRGEGKLDAHGTTELTAAPPPNLPGARYTARWEVAVTSADGQNVAAAKPPETTVMLQPALLGVDLQTHQEASLDYGSSGPPPGILRVAAAAFGADDQPVRTANVKMELFHVGAKVVRENVAPFVTRYHNVPRYESVYAQALPAVGPEPASVDVPVKDPGRYVVVLTAPGLKPVSCESFKYRSNEDEADADERDEVPVTTETSLVLRPEKKEYAPGESAAFLTRTPVTGVAWVSVETDRVIDQFLLPLPAKTTRLEIPVKPGYAPNARVAVYLLRPGGQDTLPGERFATAKLQVRRPDRVLDVRPTVAAASVRPGGEIRAEVRVLNDGKPVAGANVTLWAVDDAILALGEWKTPSLLDAFYPDRPFRVKTYAALAGYVESFPRKSLYEKGFIIGGGGEEFAAKFVRKVFQPLAYWKTGLKTDADGRVSVQFGAPDNLTRYRIIAVAQTKGGQFGEGEGAVEVAKPLMVEPSLPRFLRAGDKVTLRAVVRQSEHDEVDLYATCKTGAGFVLLAAPHEATSAPQNAERNAPVVFRFDGEVPDDGTTSVKISFQAQSAEKGSDLVDPVEVTLPILPPTILRRESVAGAGRPGGDVAELLPEDARRPGATGRYDVAISTSADLPRLQALPEVLEYPHGCFEQITSRVLVYCTVGDLFAGLPAAADADAARRRTVEHALSLCARGRLEDGTLPYWSGKMTNPFVTVQADWAAHLAARSGFAVDDAIVENLDRATRKIAADGGTPPYVRALALLTETGSPEKPQPAAQPGFHPKKTASGEDDSDDAADASDEDDSTKDEAKSKDAADAKEAAAFDEKAARALFLRRETLGDDGRALLAVALHRAGVMADEKGQLLREILPLAQAKRPVPERAFDPASFGSTRRTQALAIWACTEVHPPDWKPADARAARALLARMLDAAPDHSTQENLWALVAFDAVRKAERRPKLRVAKARPAPNLVSPDGTAAAWTGLALGGGNPLFRPPPDLAPAANAVLACVLKAEYRVGTAEEDTRRDRGGLRVERVVRNLTDPKRTGRTGELAVRVNDRLLVTYRMQTPKPRSYVALEDELPAGLEAVNPDLPLFAPFYDLPPTPPGEQMADLSFSELHDNVTNLYFDRLAPGVSMGAVLVRATTAGVFRWPATQAGPMYEPEVGGLAPSQELTVESEP